MKIFTESVYTCNSYVITAFGAFKIISVGLYCYMFKRLCTRRPVLLYPDDLIHMILAEFLILYPVPRLDGFLWI